MNDIDIAQALRPIGRQEVGGAYGWASRPHINRSEDGWIDMADSRPNDYLMAKLGERTSDVPSDEAASPEYKMLLSQVCSADASGPTFPQPIVPR